MSFLCLAIMASEYSALLGNVVLCTLSDGRTALGRLTCIDRMSNLILLDCVETRTVRSSDYNDKEPVLEKKTERYLQQAMVPGKDLVRVTMERRTFDRIKDQLPNP